MVTCPKCGRAAPVVTVGTRARCAACGAPRAFLAAPSVALAGSATRYVGQALRFGGVLAIVGAVLGALLALWLQGALFPSVSWLVWIDLAVVLLVALASAVMMRTGTRLVARAEAVRVEVRTAAIFALADARGGSVTAREVARALELSEASADRALTALALEEHASVEVDDARGVVYRLTAKELPSHRD